MFALRLLCLLKRIVFSLAIANILHYATVKSTSQNTPNNNRQNSIEQYSIKNDLNSIFLSNLGASTSHYNNNPDNSPSLAPHRHHNPFRHSRTKTKRNQRKYDKELLVNTQSGYVRGRQLNLDRNFQEVARTKRRRKYRLNAWLGIPYAQPPIGERRFRRPEPVESWEGIKNTTKLPHSCYQLPDTIFPGFWGTELWNANTEVNEDCLYLNIWTNSPRPRSAPVLVWIYGGSYLSGTATLKIYDPKVIVGETQAVFVSLNYRVSIFGFLYMDHESAPGNQGLLDQNMALKWIYNNIQYFGGDNSKITIFGESAGSASVSLHLLSPLSRNLYNSAIMQSGSSLADWVTLKNSVAIQRYTGILGALGCNGTTEEAMACARKVEPRHAIEKSDEYFFSRADHGIMQFPFLPVIDSYFLLEEPIISLNKGNFKKCPILLGVNKDEANWFYIYAFSEYRNLTARPELNYESFKIFLSSLFHYYPQFPSVVTEPVLDAIMFKYTHWNNVHNIEKNIESLDNVAADYHFICPALDLASTFAMNNLDVFFYHFTQRASTHLWPEWFGVLHADEISFLFGEPLYSESQNFTREEKIFSRKLLKYWSNFVRYNDPNGPGEHSADAPGSLTLSSNGVYSHKISNDVQRNTLTMRQEIEPWPKYVLKYDSENDEQRAFLELNADEIRLGHNFRAEYCSFWGSYLPSLMLKQEKNQINEEICPTNAPANKSNSATKLNYSILIHTVLIFLVIL